MSGAGSLEEQDFAEGSFDAVTLNHVSEHVPDPLRTIAECARILKPAGELVMFTPNGSSLGHWMFKRNWRGLEPPRHVQIFTIQSLVQILRRAAFQKVTVRPQIAKSVIYESFLLWRGTSGRLGTSHRNWPAWVFARLFTLLELCLCGGDTKGGRLYWGSCGKRITFRPTKRTKNGRQTRRGFADARLAKRETVNSQASQSIPAQFFLAHHKLLKESETRSIH
jgi:SAM-dependent methyltransferase